MGIFPDSSFFLFLIAAFLAFYVPGNVFLHKKLEHNFLANFVIGTTLGIVLWSIVGFVTGYIGLRMLMYPYLFLTFVIWLKLNFRSISNFNLKGVKVDILSAVIVVVGTTLNLSAVWYMGVYGPEGLFFCCRGVPDAIYQLSLTDQIIKNFPPFEPGMAGVIVKNYHFLSNLAVADLSRVFNIDFIPLQFRYINLLLAILLGTSAFVLGNLLKLRILFSRTLAIFLYGSGDIIYFLLFLRGKGFDFSVTIVDDATKLLAGPPRAFSMVIFFAGLGLIILWIRKKDLYIGILSALMMGVLVGFKIYTGIFAVMGFAILGIYYFIRRDFRMMIPSICSVLIAFAYFVIVNKDSGGLDFSGMWRFENFILHSKLLISKLEYLRIDSLMAKNYFVVFLLESLFVITYFLFLFGTINLGWLQNKKSLKLLPLPLNIFLINGIILSVIFGSLFVQATGGANTIQFLISAFLVGSIYASLSIYYCVRKIRRKIIGGAVIFLVLLFTLPRAVHEIWQNFTFIGTKQGILVNNGQLEALSYIAQKTPSDSAILLEPWTAEEEQFIYIAFLANRPLFLASAGGLRDHGQKTREREDINRSIFNSGDGGQVKSLIDKNSIDYVYVPEGTNFASYNKPFVIEVFKNPQATIYA